jgi:dephospho-CoA kinase
MRGDFIASSADHVARTWLILMRADSQLGGMLQHAGANVVTITVPESIRRDRLAARDVVRSEWPSVFARRVEGRKAIEPEST